MSGSAGVEIANFMFNDSRSYIIPVTTFNLDFDESIKKRISTNSKIRFSLDFDLGQSVGTDLTEGDLVSYTFFNTNLSIRYNHSPSLDLGQESIMKSGNIKQVQLEMIIKIYQHYPFPLIFFTYTHLN